MADPLHDAATAKALLDRLSHARLPRTLELLDRVEAGARMDDADILFLKEALDDARMAQGFIAGHPELHGVASRVVSLYGLIVRRAMENEAKGN